jgi:hypothetical protein
MRARIPTGAGNLLWRAGNDSNDSLVWLQADPLSWAEDWHFFAFVKNENAGTMSIYFDGFVEDWKDGVRSTLTEVAGKSFRIGADNDQQSDYTGKLDDFRIYDYALSDSEIQGLFRGGDVNLAWAPSPYDGETGVSRDVNVSWWPGNHAAQHKVFFGTDWDDVNDMTEPCDTLALGNEEWEPGQLELGKPYYWRVDEVNDNAWAPPGSPWKRSPWGFTVADYVVLDDFETYTGGSEPWTGIQYTWYDQLWQGDVTGYTTGSWLTLATLPTYPVHRGEQAMEYWYDTNDTAYATDGYWYAEAWLPLDELGHFQNWTSVNVRILTVFFYGLAENDANDTEQMYMGVTDTDGLYGEVRYGDNTGEALSDLQVEEWQRWDVPFVYYKDGNFAEVVNNVDFTSVASVHIGFGDPRNPVQAGDGYVYFDDLRLSMPYCRPEYGPTGDLSGDCFVGVADIGTMGEQWLRRDVNANPVTAPPGSDPNLVGHWKLDGDANDSSGSAYHGAAEGSYSWVTGKDGQAIDLSGGWVVVDDNGVTPKLRMKEKVSVMAWVYIEDPGAETKVVVKGEDNEETFGLEVDNDDGAAFIFRDVNGEGPYSVDCGYGLQSYEWYHTAGTYDQNEQIVYVNGAEENSETPGAVELFTDPNDGLGIGGRYGDGADFEGKIDDVRVYDRAVTAAEIGYIACGSDGLCPLESRANFYTGDTPEVIDFKDYAKIFDYWGAKQLWPPEP